VALVVPGHRILEPEDVVRLAQTRGAQRARQIPALVRIEHELDVRPDRFADHAHALSVGFGREPRDLYLERAIAVLEVHGGLTPEIIRALAVAIVEAGDVGGHARTQRAAEQGVHGPIRRLAHEIPERDVDGADRRHELAALLRQRRDAAHARVSQREQVLPDALDAERILADDQRPDALEDLVDRAHALLTTLGQERPVRLADPDEPGVGRQA
jgi:hypothetical protein